MIAKSVFGELNAKRNKSIVDYRQCLATLKEVSFNDSFIDYLFENFGKYAVVDGKIHMQSWRQKWLSSKV